jgi:hypothetical protein
MSEMRADGQTRDIIVRWGRSMPYGWMFGSEGREDVLEVALVDADLDDLDLVPAEGRLGGRP